jgi:cytochrome c oxidase subunit 3
MHLAFDQNTGRNKIHPQKFAMWVGCGSLMMMFASLTSAYIVRQSAGNWLEFPLPSIFGVSTVAIVLSSVSLQGAFISFKKGKERPYKMLLGLTFLLGMVFLILQYSGWVAMKAMGVPLTMNPSGDFVYVISWIHAAHVIGGIAALTVAMIHAFGLKFRPGSKRLLRLELTTTYWHFVDFLWVYLFLFLTFYR